MKQSFEKEAATFTFAIKLLAENEDNLNNLESYLIANFDSWLFKFANTPENIASELKEFAEMEF